MASISVPTALAVASTATQMGGSLMGGSAQSGGAAAATQAEAQSAAQAMAALQQYYNQAQGYLGQNVTNSAASVPSINDTIQGIGSSTKALADVVNQSSPSSGPVNYLANSVPGSMTSIWNLAAGNPVGATAPEFSILDGTAATMQPLMQTANGGGPVASTLNPFIQGQSIGQQGLLPFTTAGQNATSALSTGLGIGTPSGQGSLNTPLTAAQFQSSPGYQFQLQQGLDAILNKAAATGGAGMNGNTLKALQTYGTGLANQDWNNAYAQNQGYQAQTISGLQNLAGTGANTGTSSAQIGANAGNTLANAILSAQQSAGQIGQAAAGNLTNNMVGATEAMLSSATSGANTSANIGANSASSLSQMIADAVKQMYSTNSNAYTNQGQTALNMGSDISSILTGQGQNAGNNLIGAANSQSGGIMGAANALSGGLNNQSNQNFLSGLMGGTGSSTQNGIFSNGSNGVGAFVPPSSSYNVGPATFSDLPIGF